MYLRLGNTKINYVNPDYDDFNIVAEVLDSPMSYEKPVLIHSKSELDIWFGKNFNERSYLDELIQKGITLYLYKPISTEPNAWQKDYIDLSNYLDEENKYYTESDYEFVDSTIGDLIFSSMPEIGEENIIYKFIKDSGKYDVGFSSLKYNKLVWSSEFQNYINIDDLVQNTGINTSSMNNRDTLRLCKPGNDLEYCFYEYQEDLKKNVYIGYDYYIFNGETWEIDNTNFNYSYAASSLEELKNVVAVPKVGDRAKISKFVSPPTITSTSQLSMNKLVKEYQTYAFSYSLTGSKAKDEDFLIISDKNGNLENIHFGNVLTIDEKYYKSETKVNSVEELLKRLTDLGYSILYNTETRKNIIVSPFVCPINYFYSLTAMTLEPEMSETHKMLSRYTKSTSRIEFSSKTIGTEGVDANIKIEIEKLEKDNYRISISRYDYLEVFEGYIFKTGEERLDYQITKNSKLVRCLIKDVWGDNINYKEEDDELPIGNWILSGAKEETVNEDSFENSLNYLFDSTIYFDFLLIPDITKYDNTVIQESYYRIYTTLLELAETKNCQVLIENSKDNYMYNYVEDTYNRLIYFYNGIYIGNSYRPGYYIFLQGLLLQDTYSATTNYILYESPLESTELDPYNESTTLSKKLENYKSNYLIDNGQIYFYKGYFDGDKPNTTGLMRFVLGKTSRELEKHKWNYLGEKMTGKVQEKIQNVVDLVRNSFSIIRTLSITYINIDFYNNKINLTLDTEISDLIKNNMSLDITLNFNKELWQQ